MTGVLLILPAESYDFCKEFIQSEQLFASWRGGYKISLTFPSKNSFIWTVVSPSQPFKLTLDWSYGAGYSCTVRIGDSWGNATLHDTLRGCIDEAFDVAMNSLDERASSLNEAWGAFYEAACKE